MSIRLKIGAQRKEGTDNYGSIGASCEVEGVEIPAGATPEQILEIRDYWFGLCEMSVQQQLAVLRGAGSAQAAAPAANGHAAPPPRQPAPPRERERQTWPTADHGEAARERPRPARGGDRGDAPRSGRALYARLKDMDEADEGLKVVKHVSRWAKARGNDSRMTDWSDDQAADGWREACRYLEALRESASLQGASY